MTRRFLAVLALAGAALCAQPGGELRFCLRADPKTFDPLLVEDDNSETVRYLTGGVLLRIHRVTQQLTPELATSWRVDLQGRRITFQLRRDVAFSDGTPFTAEDVAFTMNRLMDPNTHSATADPFRSSDAKPEITVRGTHEISITFGAPVSGVERLFDQVAMLSAKSPNRLSAVLGPFVVAEHKPGVELVLRRNPRYWKTDSAGRRLPYLDQIRLSIQQNRDLELVRFRRGELDLINSVEPDTFGLIAGQSSSAAIDAGVSLEPEMMWFNQVASAPLPAYKKAWFVSTEFRRAVSEAINREDIAKIVYKGHARPAEGPVSAANKFWFNASLKPHPHDTGSALKRLAKSGFTMRDGSLYDRENRLVEFSAMTNAGNKSRERILSMIQQDLKVVGIRMNVVTLDFPSLIERMTQTFQYEACLLGLTNLDLDPSAQMNVWLSSADNHQWNPKQKTPATPWEAEIDRLMRAQASDLRPEQRKRSFDRVQQIVWEQEPFLYLVYKNALMAFSPQVANTAPSSIQPRSYWNIEFLRKPAVLAQSR